MGDPKHARKKYANPKKPWDKKRLDEERVFTAQYGLKNKRELRRFESILRKKRHSARSLLALPLEQRMKREKELIGSLTKIGLLDEKATLDDVLTLNVRELSERRLQTIIYRKGLANTLKQARQFIVHGHIALNEKKITIPGYIVKKGEEEKLSYYGKPIVLAQKKTKEQVKKEFEEIDKEAKKISGKETAEESPVQAVEAGAIESPVDTEKVENKTE